jgi:release factor glutamine methyltransferase
VSAVAPAVIGLDLDSVLRQAATRLGAAGVDSPRLDARVLIAHALGLTPGDVLLRHRRAIAPAEQRAIDRLIARRARREPVSRIVGAREFWSLPFRVTPATLDPRPDSETVVSAVLDRLLDRLDARDRALRLLDLGTGTGCLLLALLSELPLSRGLGVDVSTAALAVARANARALGLKQRARFRHGVWAAGLAGRFDVIVSNPPYIPGGMLAGLPAEVSFDPVGALDGGRDGLAAYRAIGPALARLLAPDGVAALEIGADQAAAVGAILARSGLRIAKIVCDLANNERVVVAQAPVDRLGAPRSAPRRKKRL